MELLRAGGTVTGGNVSVNQKTTEAVEWRAFPRISPGALLKKQIGNGDAGEFSIRPEITR